MAGDQPTTTPSNVTAPREIKKRKREPPTTSRLTANKSARTSTPNAYSRRTPPPEPKPIDSDDDEVNTHRRSSPARQLKRPGAGARIAREQREAAELARRKREDDERRRALSDRLPTSGAELVAEHYNAVPERGREWRKTDSQIKGLRSLNNWIKSTLIQKFSAPDVVPQHGMTVLDMACGKGGDLGKWEKAPVVPRLYVGCDVADVSIQQARERYAESVRKSSGRGRRGVMEAQFYVHDTFGKSLVDVPIIRQVGFDPNAGPGPGVIQGGMMSGGFDVVSMMFALHYSFESEALARGMLGNVAGALRKGGKFIGVMPDSDVISARVKRLLQVEGGVAAGQTQTQTPTPVGKSVTPKENGVVDGVKADDEDGEWDPEKPADANGEVEAEAEVEADDWDPEKPSDPAPATTNGTTTTSAENAEDGDDDWDPEKPSDSALPALETLTNGPTHPNGTSPTPQQPLRTTTTPPNPDLPPLEWGNSIYHIRFPHNQPLQTGPSTTHLPRDGTFRPPYGWKYHYSLAEAVDAPEYVVPWEAFRALASDYGLELLYRKGFREVFDDESSDRELGMLAERMGVMSRDRAEGTGGCLVSEEEMEAAGFYLAFCFYKV
ncbi:hypothetical protein BAUCODRAFT_63678 [Baudoinia panamericana UAMH 10762]|uniref:mRNA cap guanine-N(7) methyltransferase n=1 Tax=Baudoinia panamericana (strain UAMH 10762) TaxID=717646 RepID=M2N7Q7_BAUPA|nr:uncharacterized protein BAUCODRAFT_63678 [Baudoinia panamericana UAMH 10762]EMD00139.1 hypothetical protein BAUCODRAFT_63678 [Baudoinia panamericana UAMH 10762]